MDGDFASPRFAVDAFEAGSPDEALGKAAKALGIEGFEADPVEQLEVAVEMTGGLTYVTLARSLRAGAPGVVFATIDRQGRTKRYTVRIVEAPESVLRALPD